MPNDDEIRNLLRDSSSTSSQKMRRILSITNYSHNKSIVYLLSDESNLDLWMRSGTYPFDKYITETKPLQELISRSFPKKVVVETISQSSGPIIVISQGKNNSQKPSSPDKSSSFDEEKLKAKAVEGLTSVKNIVVNDSIKIGSSVKKGLSIAKEKIEGENLTNVKNIVINDSIKVGSSVKKGLSIAKEGFSKGISFEKMEIGSKLSTKAGKDLINVKNLVINDSVRVSGIIKRDLSSEIGLLTSKVDMSAIGGKIVNGIDSVKHLELAGSLSAVEKVFDTVEKIFKSF